MRFLVLSGLSGAGKTTAKGFLEDLGYFMVDNLPPRLWKPLLEELKNRGVERAGVVLDARALAFFPDLEEALRELRPTVVYLEARPEVLLRRYNLTRRLHPLGAGNLMREIGQEREILSALREKAHLVLDTSDLSPRALKDALARFLGEEAGFILRLLSFGFKWGPPQEADLVLDVPAPSPTPTTTPSSSPRPAWTPRSGPTSSGRRRNPFTGPFSRWRGSRRRGPGRRGGPFTPWPWGARGGGTAAWPWPRGWPRTFPAGSGWR
jgi:UPF0042 nucleotide-binding protein